MFKPILGDLLLLVPIDALNTQCGDSAQTRHSPIMSLPKFRRAIRDDPVNITSRNLVDLINLAEDLLSIELARDLLGLTLKPRPEMEKKFILLVSHGIDAGESSAAGVEPYRIKPHATAVSPSRKTNRISSK
jgi:hypothetical protein